MFRFLSSVLVIFYASASALCVPLDFDGDGISDIGTFYDQADGSRNERVYQFILSTGAESSRIEFGNTGDFDALGDYDGDGIVDLGIVQEDIEKESLTWTIRDFNGDRSTFEFGVKDDVVFSGCDIDGDGKADAAIIRDGSILYRASGSEDVETSISLDSSSEISFSSVLCSDLDGDDLPEFLFIGVPNGASGSRLYVYNSDGALLLESSAKHASRPLSFDVDEDGTPEVGFVKTTKRRIVTNMLSLEGTRSVRKLRSSIPVRDGQDATFLSLSSGEDEELAPSVVVLGKRNRFYRYDMASGATTKLDNRLSEVDTLVQPHELSYTGASSPSDPEGLCDTVENMADGAYGRLWKESDHGGLVVLLTRCDGYKAKSVQVLSNGQVIATLAYSSAANPDQCGNRDHFRHPKHAASFPPNILLLVTTTKNEKRCYDIGPRPGSRVD